MQRCIGLQIKLQNHLSQEELELYKQPNLATEAVLSCSRRVNLDSLCCHSPCASCAKPEELCSPVEHQQQQKLPSENKHILQVNPFTSEWLCAMYQIYSKRSRLRHITTDSVQERQQQKLPSENKHILQVNPFTPEWVCAMYKSILREVGCGISLLILFRRESKVKKEKERKKKRKKKGERKKRWTERQRDQI